MYGDVLRARRAHHRARRAAQAGDRPGARHAQDRAIELYTRTDPRTPAQAAELAAILTVRAEFAYADGDCAHAAHLYTRARDALQTHPRSPNRDRALLAALIGLAHSQRRLGAFADATASLDAAQALNPDPSHDPLAATAMWNALGVLAKDTGRYTDAATHYATALEVLDAAPEQLSLHATLQHNLAGLAHIQGHFAQAEAPARRAVELRRRAPDATPTDIAADEAVLASILVGLDRLDEAETLLRAAIATWTAHFGPQHYEIAVCLHNLGDIQRIQGHHDNAAETLHRALAIKRHLLGDHHPEIAALLHNLAALEDLRGDTTTAAHHRNEALTIFRATLGDDHPHTTACRNATRTTRPTQQHPDSPSNPATRNRPKETNRPRGSGATRRGQ